MLTVDARNLSLKDVHQVLKLKRKSNQSFTELLPLEPLTNHEQEDLDKIRNNFDSYYAEAKISEGQVKFLFLSPLLWLAGFYQPSIKITLEENIVDIFIEDEDTLIKGRMDILAVNNTVQKTGYPLFWIMVVEAKNSSINALEGLPQLLTYASKSLEDQESVWGLTTNGVDYRFVYLKQGNPSTYQLLPQLNLLDSESSIQILQVLKAICKIQHTPESD
ncbi:restriction endonuclease subunit R [Gloeocapsopsis dulcis]|uniref:Restriction endonuclease subunit R n=1 Tax=Gloeocapsopsis dulcis AAB1 = 1H9 TaxID=1433147 RepID=A0A6N8FQV0_9CHRO|nr:restriction endonuclease subunit R [Gloeocapsopsis dulcis]MUL35391.1 restriction endonuclease subunit R [Gloeocapsopsis dulcis AAB1 = 1H9]WNN90410.1 restriction endonuclease subunit R [Gloeocapsopsis dulcis]